MALVLRKPVLPDLNLTKMFIFAALELAAIRLIWPEQQRRAPLAGWICPVMSELLTINSQHRVRQWNLSRRLLFSDFLGTPSYFWLIFISVVVGLLVLDLGFLHKGQKEIEAKESFILYGGYMAIAFAFGAWVWYARGAQSGLEFFTGYLIEQSLAMDNIFVIATVFAFLGIPRIYQHRVLFWGILGVIVFRAILIGLGAALVMSFSLDPVRLRRLPGLHRASRCSRRQAKSPRSKTTGC